jgi:hypothetical protein
VRRVGPRAAHQRSACLGEADPWEQLQPWLVSRVELPVGPLLCVVTGAHARPPLVARGGARRVPPHRDGSERATPLRATSASRRAKERQLLAETFIEQISMGFTGA